MPNFAVVKQDRIINVIVADTKEIAEELTGCTVIETIGEPWIGWKLVDNVWQYSDEPLVFPEPTPEILEESEILEEPTE